MPYFLFLNKNERLYKFAVCIISRSFRRKITRIHTRRATDLPRQWFSTDALFTEHMIHLFTITWFVFQVIIQTYFNTLLLLAKYDNKIT